MQPSPHRTTPSVRREPARVLFPLGALLGVLSVLPFPLRSAGGGALGLFHPVAQTLGFLTCFALGFLFTIVPRLTHTRAADPWDLLAAVALPPLMVASAWTNASAVPYLLWFYVVAVALHFTVSRLRVAPRAAPPPVASVWLPLALAAGVIGALLAAIAPLLSEDGAPPAWTIGRGLLSQGLAAGLVLGLAGPVARRWSAGELDAAPSGPAPSRRRSLAAHAAAAVVFFGSFPLEVLVHVRAGLALRAAVATGVLAAAGLHRTRAVTGAARRLAWIGTWLVPTGFWLAAAVPRQRAAALHVVFVGGFALLALAGSVHVTLEGRGVGERRRATPGALLAMAVLLGGAFAARLLAAYESDRVARWLSYAAICFTGAVVAWAIALAPALIRSARR